MGRVGLDNEEKSKVIANGRPGKEAKMPSRKYADKRRKGDRKRRSHKTERVVVDSPFTDLWLLILLLLFF